MLGCRRSARITTLYLLLLYPRLLLQLLAKVATSKIAAKKGFSRVGLSSALHQEIH